MLQQSTYKLQCLFKLLKSQSHQNVADTASIQHVSFAGHRSLFYQYRKYPKHL